MSLDDVAKQIPQLTADSYGFNEQSKALIFEYAEGYDFWKWPETQALLQRLGLDLGAPTTNTMIYIPVEGTVRIFSETIGQDMTTVKKRWLKEQS